MAEWDNLVIDFFRHQTAFHVPRAVDDNLFQRADSANDTFPRVYSSTGNFILGFFTKRSSTDYARPVSPFVEFDWNSATNNGSYGTREGGLYCDIKNDQENLQQGNILIEPARWGCARPMQILVTIHSPRGATGRGRRHGRIELQLDPTPERAGDGVKGVLDCFDIQQKNRVGIFHHEFVRGPTEASSYYFTNVNSYGNWISTGFIDINPTDNYGHGVYLEKRIFKNTNTDDGRFLFTTIRTPNSYRGFQNYSIISGAVQILRLYDGGELKKEIEHWYESFNLRLAVYQPNDTTGKAKVFFGVLDQGEAWGMVEECEADFLQHDTRGKLGHAFAKYRIVRPAAATSRPVAFGQYTGSFIPEYHWNLTKELYGYDTAQGIFADPAFYDMNVFLTSLEYSWDNLSYHIATLPPINFERRACDLRPFCKRSGGALGDYMNINRDGTFYFADGSRTIPDEYQIYKGGHFPYWGFQRDQTIQYRPYAPGNAVDGCEQPVALYSDQPSHYHQREFVKKSYFAAPKSVGNTHAPAFADDNFTAKNLSVIFRFDELEVRSSHDKWSPWNPRVEFIDHKIESYNCGDKKQSFVIRYREQYTPGSNHLVDPFNTNFTIEAGAYYGQRLTIGYQDYSSHYLGFDYYGWHDQSAFSNIKNKTDGHIKSVSNSTFVWNGSEWIDADTSDSNQITSYRYVGKKQKRAGDYIFQALDGVTIDLGDNSSAGNQLAQGLYYGDNDLGRKQIDSEPMAIISQAADQSDWRFTSNRISWSDNGPPPPRVGDGGLTNPTPSVTSTGGATGGNNTSAGGAVTGGNYNTGAGTNTTTGTPVNQSGSAAPRSEFWRHDHQYHNRESYYSSDGTNLIAAIEENIKDGNAGVVFQTTSERYSQDVWIPPQQIGGTTGDGGSVTGGNAGTDTLGNPIPGTGGNANNAGDATFIPGYWETQWFTRQSNYYLASPLCYYYNNKTRAVRCQAFGSVVKNIKHIYGEEHADPIGQLKAPSDFYETDGEEKATSSGLLAHKGGLGSAIPYAPGQVRFNFVLYLDCEEVCEDIAGYGGVLRSNQYSTWRKNESIEVDCPPIQVRDKKITTRYGFYTNPSTGQKEGLPLRHIFGEPVDPIPSQLASTARVQLRCGVILSASKAQQLKSGGFVKVNFPVIVYSNYGGEETQSHINQYQNEGSICYAVIDEHNFPGATYSGGSDNPDAKNSEVHHDFQGLNRTDETINTAGVVNGMNARTKFLRRLSENNNGSISLRLS